MRQSGRLARFAAVSQVSFHIIRTDERKGEMDTMSSLWVLIGAWVAFLAGFLAGSVWAGLRSTPLREPVLDQAGIVANEQDRVSCGEFARRISIERRGTRLFRKRVRDPRRHGPTDTHETSSHD
jgi:hypothetical protein